MNADRSNDSEPRVSPTDYPPDGDPSDVSAAQTDTETSDTEPVTDSNPGATTGDTSGDDRLGADDTR